MPPNGVVILEEPLHFSVNMFKAKVVEVNAEHNKVLLSLNDILLRTYASGYPYVKEGVYIR